MGALPISRPRERSQLNPAEHPQPTGDGALPSPSPVPPSLTAPPPAAPTQRPTHITLPRLPLRRFPRLPPRRPFHSSRLSAFFAAPASAPFRSSRLGAL